jgi:hypothetical protein
VKKINIDEIVQGFYACRLLITCPKRDYSGEWRKLLNEELQNLYSSPNTIRHINKRRIKWAEHVTRIGQERKLYKVLV